ncbi:hypothetical protein VD0002_g6841 [Verticillium dahliae]|uniref:U6 snRNA phosphodiesterase n=2 Tax=Verticillium dahliae TaxID=27337 RepID=G2X8G4_VERDV|nr:uncharacterized protein VDAG_06105 [Verticillium dahliae VdLs.17]KAF3342323.1 Amine oxidase [Verticillium dahliae VDG2]KAH6697893.1 hypothetical protein EV126DRAFT_62402 [Verticillium dahliae]EGY15251.1 hypothetical protein VDAG_06105 [Verticillium dahliae VdLs.17]PNH36040.1 hypothetical protein BJF96_g654 [Verticillium dahliae]PNH49276.1 hypothetical protein VD0003_g7857 [Verticillium dahliae]
MALVDYSSDSSVVTADSEIAPPPAKKQRSGGGPDGKGGEASHPTASDLPPLPESFHDLYASSVRQSVSDDPSLHNGRKRLTPHVAGNWPSHVYIEWHPTTEQHALLVEFLDAAQKQLGTTHRLHSFLTSDLNAPLPLHISLSKSLSLTTANKDAFLDALTSSLRPTSAAVKGPFTVSPSGLAFYKSPDSDRAFLVLRVADPKAKPPIPGTSANPQLRELLRRCNTVASSRGLPTLYASRDQVEAANKGEADAEADALVDNAFHVSIAWTFALPDEEMCIRTYRIFRAPSFKKLRNWEVRVSGVKVKIGNVVTHVLLGNGKVAGGGRSSRESSRSARSPTGDDSPY